MITVDEHKRVYYDDNYVGRIYGETDDGKLLFISAFVGGIQQGSSLMDVVNFGREKPCSKPKRKRKRKS